MVARLRRPGFARNVAVLAGGAAGAQIINAAISPVLTRLFDPSEIGQLGLYLAFVYVAAMVLSLRFEQAIVVPAGDAAAAGLAVLAGLLVPVMSVIAAVVLFALIEVGLGGYDSLPLVAVPIALVGLVAFGYFGVIRYWLIRQSNYRVLSEVSITQSIGRAVGQVVAGLAGLGIVGLLIGDLIGRAVGLGRMYRAAEAGFRQSRTEAHVRIGRLARLYWRFPIIGVPSSLLNAAAFSLPVPLLASGYGLATAGYFALVQRVLGLPMSIIGMSVSDTLLAHISDLANSRPAAALPLFRRTAFVLALIGAPIALAVIVLGPAVFDLVFGPEWRTAGVMAAIMAPWYLAAFIVSPLSRVSVVYQGQGWKLVYDTLSLVAVVASLVGGAAAGLTTEQAIALLSGLQVIAYVVYFLILYHLVRQGRPGVGPVIV